MILPLHRIALVAAITAVSFLGIEAIAAESTLTSTVKSSGYNGGTIAAIPLTADGSFVPDVTPWTYDAAAVSALQTIDTISLSLVLGSAATSFPGDTNFDELTLGLDGIDTGLKLNGEWQVITTPGQPEVRPPLIFTGTPLNANLLIAALKTDGKLVGTILDADPGDDFITLGSTQGGLGDTTLVINGQAQNGENPPPAVPLPGAAWMAMATLVSYVGARAVRRRRQSA